MFDTKGPQVAVDTTDLREALSAVQTAEKVKCPMQKLLDTLDEETRLVVEEKVFDMDFPYTRIHKELRRAGFKISAETVGDHRNGRCVCN